MKKATRSRQSGDDDKTSGTVAQSRKGGSPGYSFGGKVKCDMPAMFKRSPDTCQRDFSFGNTTNKPSLWVAKDLEECLVA
jgi:hypothetical protein